MSDIGTQFVLGSAVHQFLVPSYVLFALALAVLLVTGSQLPSKMQLVVVICAGGLVGGVSSQQSARPSPCRHSAEMLHMA